MAMHKLFSPLAQPLLEEHKDVAPKPLFPENFYYSRQVDFRKACRNANLGDVVANLEKVYLEPVLYYMTALQIQDDVVTGTDGKSFNGLLNLINEMKGEFVKLPGKALSSSALKLILEGFAKLERETKNYVYAAHAPFAAKHNQVGVDAQAEIATARALKAYDFCCIAACIVWIPMENLITLGNCCGAGGPSQECCTGECDRNLIKTGDVHPWAPVGSIRSLVRDWIDQDEVIERAAPAVQRM